MPRSQTRPKPALLRTRTTTGQSLSLRHQLGFVFYAWTFGSFWLWTISGAAMTRFSREMGVPDYGFGVLATLPFVGTLLQVPASYLLEKYGQRKAVFLILGGLGRLMWTVTAMIPWLLPNAREWWWPTMALSLLFTWSCAQASVPAWMNWMSDVIPRRIRGRYFGLRNQVGQPIGLITTLGIGYALDQATVVQATRPDIMLHVTSAILALGGLMGTLDILCFRYVDDKPTKREPSTDGLVGMMLRPLKQAEFRRYLMFNFMLTLGIACIGQYIWLYLFDVVGWSNQRANMMLIGVPLIVRMLSFSIWGRLIDRLGKKPVMLIAGGLSVVDTIGWLLVGPDGYMLGYSLVLLAVFAWPGMEIANFNFILNMAGGGRDKERNGGMAYVAINSIAIAMGGIASGLLGAVVAKTLGNWSYDLTALDIHLTYHSVLLLAAAVLKALSLLWALGLHEPQAVGTRVAMRYMTTSIYSNVRQAVLMPTRIVGRAARWSYQINTRTRRR
jgi:MFS family permease